MREGWTYKKLKEATIKISDGSHNPPKGIEYSDYPMLSSKNVFFDFFNYDSPRYLSKEDFDLENKRTNISNGDVLLTIVGTVGRTCCVQTPFIPFTLQRSVAVLKPQKGVIIPRFLMYSLHSLTDLWESEAKGVAQKGIYLKQLAEVPIPIPPLAEQERIVAELDLLSSIIEKKKAQLKELDQLAQSIFYDMFGDPITNEKGWEVKTIGDFVNVKGGFAFKSNGYTQSGVRLVQIANVWKDNLKWDDIVFVSNENANNCSDYLLNKGDIVMAMTRPIIKSLEAVKIAVVSEEDLPCILNQRVCKFDLHNGLNSIWLYQFLRLPFFKNKIDLFGSKGMQPNVSSREIESIPLFLPPIHLQEIFADKVEAIKRQKTLIQQSIDEVQTMFDYTMDKYFG